MSEKDLKFTEKHEWAKIEGEIAVVGISNYAQNQFGDIVFIELPSVGDETTQGDACANIESVKAVEDFFAPVSGEVIEVNENLESAPESINKDPYGEGWICKIKMADSAELDSLMNNNAYEDYLKGIEE
jgi:glycine cleavage system H protein